MTRVSAHWKESLERWVQDVLEERLEARLPELLGSERQVQWAVALRTQRLQEVGEYLQTLVSAPACGAGQMRLLVLTWERLCNQERATWWIETRNEGSVSVFARLCLELGSEYPGVTREGEQKPH